MAHNSLSCISLHGLQQSSSLCRVPKFLCEDMRVQKNITIHHSSCIQSWDWERERAQNIHLKEVKQKLLPGPLQIFHFLNFPNNLSLSLNMKYTQNSQTHRQWESEKLFQAHSLNLEALINESANIHLTSSSFFSKKKRRFLSAYIWYRHKFRLSSCKVLRIHLALN